MDAQGSFHPLIQNKSELYGSPFGKWEMVMIVLHPTGNPKDMKNMVGALGGKL